MRDLSQLFPRAFLLATMFAAVSVLVVGVRVGAELGAAVGAPRAGEVAGFWVTALALGVALVRWSSGNVRAAAAAVGPWLVVAGTLLLAARAVAALGGSWGAVLGTSGLACLVVVGVRGAGALLGPPRP